MIIVTPDLRAGLTIRVDQRGGGFKGHPKWVSRPRRAQGFAEQIRGECARF